MVGSDKASLEAEIAYIQSTGTLGRSGTVLRLFNFIVERTLSGTRPNEAEIAVEVFGRSGSFEAGQDAVVRVYVHRLRKRLDDYYVRHPEREHRLIIPRGEYRLVLETVSVGATPVAVRGRGRVSKRTLIASGAAALLLAGVAAGYGAANLGGATPKGMMQAEVWAAHKKSKRPLLIVVGDYYIYGQTDRVGNVERLVREFSVNSREDLHELMMIGEGESDDAVDLGLGYLPVATAEALRAVAPLLAAREDTRVIPASAFEPHMLQNSDVLYVGYISGLHDLEDIVFRGGRFKPGQGYDELQDTRLNRRYLSDSAVANSPQGNHKEYGYFTSISGPSGARLTVIAGTRDAGLAGVAQAMSDARIAKSLKLSGDGGVEAIIEAPGEAAIGVSPRVIAMAPRAAR